MKREIRNFTRFDSEGRNAGRLSTTMSLPPPGGYLQSPPRHRKSASTGSPGSLASHHSRHGAGSYGGQTIRRLSDDDVRAIFECLHHQVPLPTRLSFLIVPVGSNGLKLSPPSYEFQGAWRQWRGDVTMVYLLFSMSRSWQTTHVLLL